VKTETDLVNSLDVKEVKLAVSPSSPWDSLMARKCYLHV